MGDKNGRVLVGMTGASGVAYGIRALELLAEMPGVETHLMLTAPARMTIGLEVDRSVEEVEALASVTYPIRDLSLIHI